MEKDPGISEEEHVELPTDPNLPERGIISEVGDLLIAVKQ